MQPLTTINFHLTHIHHQIWGRLVYVDITPSDGSGGALNCNCPTIWGNSWILAALGEGRSIQLVSGNWPLLVTDEDNEIFQPFCNVKQKIKPSVAHELGPMLAPWTLLSGLLQWIWWQMCDHWRLMKCDDRYVYVYRNNAHMIKFWVIPCSWY